MLLCSFLSCFIFLLIFLPPDSQEEASWHLHKLIPCPNLWLLRISCLYCPLWLWGTLGCSDREVSTIYQSSSEEDSPAFVPLPWGGSSETRSWTLGCSWFLWKHSISLQGNEREDAEGFLPQGNTTLFCSYLKQKLWGMFGNQYSQTQCDKYRFSTIKTTPLTDLSPLEVCSVLSVTPWSLRTINLPRGTSEGWEAALFFVLWQNSPELLKFMLGRHQISISFPLSSLFC